MKFSEIAGHSEIISSLRGSVDNGKIPHAILFSGISGIGKTRLARAFAQYVHCSERHDGDSCGKCPSCLQHQNFNNPDLHFVYPIIKRDKAIVSKDYIAPWKEMLSQWSYMPVEKWNDLINAGNSQTAIMVSESDDIVSRASLSAFQENYKIFLIWLPEKMRIEAANKLLKIIEEPFEDTIFLLVSNDDSKLLPTIFSRAIRYNCRPLSEFEIISYLTSKKGVNSEIAALSAKISEGSVGKAEELACHPDEILEFSDLFKEIMRMAYALKANVMKSLSDKCAAMGREKIIRFLNYCSRMIRENYIYNLQIPMLALMTSEEEDFSRKFSPFIHEGNVESLHEEISRAAIDIERNGNPKIVLFDLMLLLSQWVRMAKPASTLFSS